MRLRGVLGARGADGVVPPHVPVGPFDVLAGASDDEDVLDDGTVRDGPVDGGLEGAGLAAPVAAVGGDDELGLAVVDALAEGVDGEPAEDDHVHGADAGAGEHGDDRLRDHRHVDGDPVALLHPERGDGVGRLGDLVLEVGVGDGAAVTGLALPLDGGAVTETGVDVAVHAVDGGVDLAADEPLRVGRVPVQNGVPLPIPLEPAGLLLPEAESVGGRGVIGVRLDVGVRGELRGRREATCFVEKVGQCLLARGSAVGHCDSPYVGGWQPINHVTPGA